MSILIYQCVFCLFSPCTVETSTKALRFNQSINQERRQQSWTESQMAAVELILWLKINSESTDSRVQTVLAQMSNRESVQKHPMILRAGRAAAASGRRWSCILEEDPDGTCCWTPPRRRREALRLWSGRSPPPPWTPEPCADPSPDRRTPER